MKILITGSTGFVASALSKKLVGHEVVMTSRSKNGLSTEKNIFHKHISSEENFLDCLDGVDVVVHAAARVHQMKDRARDPLQEFMDVNCHGTLNLARQAIASKIKRFIYISSIKVNGENTGNKTSFRFDDAHNCNDPYGISKSEAEKGLLQLAGQNNIEVTIIRPPLVYGPGVKANFRSLIKLVSLNLPIPLGSIDNKRSFVAMDNLVNLIIRCLDHPGAANQVFLVSDDEDLSTRKLIGIIASAQGKKPSLVNINFDLLNMVAKIIGKKDAFDRLTNNLQVDIEHTKNTLNWKPIVSISEAIKQCVVSLKG